MWWGDGGREGGREREGGAERERERERVSRGGEGREKKERRSNPFLIFQNLVLQINNNYERYSIKLSSEIKYIRGIPRAISSS